MSKQCSLLIAVLLITVAIAVDPPYSIPGPTRTPNADRAADREHHKALREWDRVRQMYFRNLQRSGRVPPTSIAPIEGNVDPKVFDRLKRYKMRALDRVYQAALRAWDRRRQKAFREGAEVFSEPKPAKPDIEALAIAALTGTSSSPSSPEISPMARVLDW